jgi:hypothetical protein
MNAYLTSTETCPWCKTPGCDADWVDVGIGLVQCGPFVCPNCEATSIGGFDTIEATEEEKKVGWYKPGKIGDKTNTFKGKPVGHKTALALYRAGLLDEKLKTSD